MMASKIVRQTATVLQKALTKQTKLATETTTQIATITTGNDFSVRNSKWSKDKGGSGHDSDLNERTKKMLEDTVTKIEEQLKNLDQSMHSKLNDAEQKLGVEGFFDKLRNRVQLELKRSHERISKSPDDIVKDIFNLACYSDKLDMGKLGAMKHLPNFPHSTDDLTKSLKDMTHSLGFGDENIEVITGNIPDFVDKALKAKDKNTYAMDLSYMLANWKPDQVQAKLHGNMLEIEMRRKSTDTLRDGVIEFPLPASVDPKSIKLYHCGNKHRAIVFASAKDGNNSSKDDPSWRTPKDPMF